jgi:hypothetical protein
LVSLISRPKGVYGLGEKQKEDSKSQLDSAALISNHPSLPPRTDLHELSLLDRRSYEVLGLHLVELVEDAEIVVVVVQVVLTV